MASDFDKPDKVHTLFKEEMQEKNNVSTGIEAFSWWAGPPAQNSRLWDKNNR